MPKKFFDIIPPEKISDRRLEEPSRVEVGKKSKIAQESIKEIKESLVLGGIKKRVKFKGVFLKILFLCFLFLILVAVPGLFLFSETKIEIWPETRILTLEEIITVDLNQEQSDFASWIETKIIPGKLFRDQKSGSQEFSASGRAVKEEKARGIIRVYNAHSVYSQVLVANTRFVSAEGKLFRSLKKEKIAGGRYEKGKLVPGETDIEVRAAEPGEDYNIGHSTFSIPGFAGTPKYTTFYGKSFSDMTGGFKDEVAQVTQGDLEKARDSLSKELEKESKDFLRAALPQGFVLLDKAIFQEIREEDYSAEVEAMVESFNLQLKVMSSTFIFKESDIENFAKSLINLNISEDERFQEESLEISYIPELFAKKDEEGEIDIETAKMVLNLMIKVKVYSDIDLDEFKQAILGRSSQEVETFLGDQPQIIKKKINLGPFWRRRIPEEADKVEIKLNLE